MTLDNLIIIGKNVKNVDLIENSINDSTEIFLVDSDTTEESLLNHVEGKTYKSVAYFAHYQAPETHSITPDVTYDLASDKGALVNFWNKFDTSTVDYLGCSTLKNEVWKNTLKHLEEKTSKQFRASDDNTGNLKAGGDWVLESDGVNVKEIYFTEEINKWMGLLGTVHIVSLDVNDGEGSLRQAIADAATGDTIEFGDGMEILLNTPITIDNKDIVINGGENVVTISGGNTTSIFKITSGDVEIKSLTLKNGLAQGGEGERPGRVLGHGAGGGGAGMGGAIAVSGGNVLINGVEFIDNKAKGGNGGNSTTPVGSSTTIDYAGAGGSSNFGSGGIRVTWGNDYQGNAGGFGGGGSGALDYGENNPYGGAGGFGGGGGGGATGVWIYSLAQDRISNISAGPAGQAGLFGGAGSEGQTKTVNDQGRGDGGGGGGGAGLGGALFIKSGNVTLSNSTFTGSVAEGGSGGDGSARGAAGQGVGGAIFVYETGNINLEDNVTFSNNFATDNADTYIMHLDISPKIINESIPANTTVATISTKQSISGGTYSYSLVDGTGDDDNTSFTIDGNELGIIGSPDYATKSSYSIRIKTDHDSSNFTYEKSFTLRVNQAPTSISLSSLLINESIPAYPTVAAISYTDTSIAYDKYVIYNGYKYRTLLDADVNGTGQSSSAEQTYTTMPAGFAVAPDNQDIVDNVIAPYYWDVWRLCTESKAWATKHYVLNAGMMKDSTTMWETNGYEYRIKPGSSSWYRLLIRAVVDVLPTYSLVSGTEYPDNSSFTINGNELIMNDSPNYSTKSSYSILIQVTDLGGESYEKNFTLTVTPPSDEEAPVITLAVAANRLADLVGGSLTDDGNGNYTLVSNIDLTEDLIIESNETLFINTNKQLNISANVHNKGIVFLRGNTDNQTTINNYGVFVNEGLVRSSNQYEYFYNNSGGKFYNLNTNQRDEVTNQLYYFSNRSGSAIFDVKSTFKLSRVSSNSGSYTGDYTGGIPHEVAILDGNIVEQGATWVDPGATADTGETVTASGTVNTSVVGTYTITYTATDAAGNAGTDTRTVTVVDITAPVITVTSGTDTIEAGGTWADAGATADTGETVTASGTVDANTAGTYTITYTATDAAGNVGTATRTITVGDGNFAPVGVDASIERFKGLVAFGKNLVFDMDMGGHLVTATITLPDESEWRDGDTVNLMGMPLNRENFNLSSPEFSQELVDYLENQLDVYGNFTMQGDLGLAAGPLENEIGINDLEMFHLITFGELDLSIHESMFGSIYYNNPELLSLFEDSGFSTTDTYIFGADLARLEDATSSITSGSLAATDVDQNSVLTFTLDTPVAGLTLATNGTYTFDGNNQAYADLWQGDSRVVVANWTVTDQHGATDSRELTITVNGIGVNPAPVITVTSGTDTVEEGATWTDAEATADGGETVTASGTVDTSTAGTYTITYTATDAAGNVGTATRTVTVEDTTAPVITVTSGTDTVEEGATWTDAEATADGGETVTASGTVDTSTAGTYTITYTATDAAGNVGTATRTVTVVTVTVKVTQILYMRKGWNLVSFYVTPGTASDVFAGHGDFKEIRDGNDNIIDATDPLNVTDGYYIEVAESFTLSVTGILPVSVPTKSLVAGWNLIGCPVEEIAVSYFLGKNSTIVHIQDLVNSHSIGAPPITNRLKLKRGSGYWVKSNVAATLNWS